MRISPNFFDQKLLWLRAKAVSDNGSELTGVQQLLSQSFKDSSFKWKPTKVTKNVGTSCEVPFWAGCEPGGRGTTMLSILVLLRTPFKLVHWISFKILSSVMKRVWTKLRTKMLIYTEKIVQSWTSFYLQAWTKLACEISHLTLGGFQTPPREIWKPPDMRRLFSQARTKSDVFCHTSCEQWSLPFFYQQPFTSGIWCPPPFSFLFFLWVEGGRGYHFQSTTVRSLMFKSEGQFCQMNLPLLVWLYMGYIYISFSRPKKQMNLADMTYKPAKRTWPSKL